MLSSASSSLFCQRRCRYRCCYSHISSKSNISMTTVSSSSIRQRRIFDDFSMFVIVIVLIMFAPTIRARCLDKCSCSTDGLKVNCTGAGLKSVPITFNPRLHEYTLRENDLTNLGVSRPFEAYTLLINLDLSLNRLKEIPSHTFQNQKQLKILNLSGNRISSLSSESFKGLQSLDELVLSNNSLTNISSSLFIHLKSLQRLHLENNIIATIVDDAFIGLTNLKFLSLRDNNLGFEINPSSSPSHVEDSHDRSIRNSHVIPSSLFHSKSEKPVNLLSLDGLKASLLPNLTVLDLSRNPFSGILRKFSPFALDESSPETSTWTKLTELNLDGCDIEFIEGSSFTGLVSLSILRIRDNRLTEIPADIWKDVPNVQVLELGGNLIPVESRCFEHSSNVAVEFSPLNGSRIVDFGNEVVSCTNAKSTLNPAIIAGIVGVIVLWMIVAIVICFRHRLVGCLHRCCCRESLHHHRTKYPQDLIHCSSSFLPSSIAVSSTKFNPTHHSAVSTTMNPHPGKVYSFDPPSLATLTTRLPSSGYENLGSIARNTSRKQRTDPEFVYFPCNNGLTSMEPTMTTTLSHRHVNGSNRNISTLSNNVFQRTFVPRVGDDSVAMVSCFDPIYRPRLNNPSNVINNLNNPYEVVPIIPAPTTTLSYSSSSSTSSSVVHSQSSLK